MTKERKDVTLLVKNSPFSARRLMLFLGFLVFISCFLGVSFGWYRTSVLLGETQLRIVQIEKDLVLSNEKNASLSAQILLFENEDQVKINKDLNDEIKNIQVGYRESVAAYEELLKLKIDFPKSQSLDSLYTKIITNLANRKYASSGADIKALLTEIEKQRSLSVVPVVNAPVNNSPPSSGYRRQTVETDVGSFAVDLVAADLSNTKVQVDTASDGDCRDSCPVLPLAEYVSRSGGFAGINGPYFCPAEYPSCAGKTNSFDTLLMNRKKVYFNSDNNIYSTVPAVIFSGNSARFVSASRDWGRDTGVDAVIASQPLLLLNGEIKFGGDGDPKKGSRGGRSFIGTKGNVVYIGVVRGATVAEVAWVLKKLGLDNALNLDGGGSVALYNGGRYLVGPGRNTPFGIVLVRK